MRAERIKRPLVEASTVRVPARAPRWIIPTVKACLALSDALIAAASFMTAFYLREGISVIRAGEAGSFRWSTRFAPYGALLILVVLIRLLALRYYDLYRLRGEFSFVDDAVRIFKATAIGSLLIVASAFLYRGGFRFSAFSYSRGVFIFDFLLVLAATSALRVLVRGLQSVVRQRDINLIPTLVVGRGAEAALCIREMRERPSLGYRVIGVVENGTIDRSVPEVYEGVPVVSDLKGLPEAIRDSGANEVIIADPQVNGDALFDVMMRCGRRRGVEFRIAPSLFNCIPRKTEIDQIGALPMIRLFREPLSGGARLVKRAFDLAIASFALLIFSPLWFLIAVLIKLDSRGPVIYKQERVGMDGRIFLFYKFRTMRADADDRLHREYQEKLIAGRPEANVGDVEKPAYKLRADARITRLGRILRRLSLDELPQLLNVLRGDMSVVGPRPPIPYEVENYELWHRKRLDMKPGVTGLWQVSGRNRLPFEEMVRLDLFYIENWSLLLDLKIILRTLPVMLRGDDAY
ncbi:MAG TPA: sugar transferase [Pyrinomonadaceae bacterium]|jgi:exopolysaccharide biosynthesis polyprenyl glycosylphosphotransferase